MSVAVGTVGEGAHIESPYGGGLMSWITTVDHKRIGIMYGVSALIFLILGGIEALTIRVQLAKPDMGFVSPELFNQLFTMHGTTMIFLAVMPLSAAFFNFMIPLMIGARDVAFPRLNAFSYWMFLAGALFINSSWFLGGAPNGGWFGYANNTEKMFNPGHGIDFWILGLQILGIASLAAALNFLTTIINMRAPGMTMMRLPVFVWMTLVTQFLIVLAFPVITIALAELMMDRMFGTNFFEVAKGGLPIVWQHLFWVFGHPEVYILILPAMGVISEVLPVFSRKPLFGYPVIVFSGVAIGFLGFTVWSHHMFTTGLGAIANVAFSLTTMTIAVPTGVKIFNWIGTLWGGKIRMKTPMLFAIGFIAMFMMGGLGGIMHASPPSDAQQQDTYFIVGHIHYVLIGGSIMALFSGLYYWFPKITGRMANEGLGKLSFWLIFFGLNFLAIPMHLLGMDGMPRRIFTYPAGMGWDALNMVATIGAFVLGIGILVTIHNLFSSARKGEIAGPDPWDARTLEWSIPSPPPVYNFATVPVVKALDDLWITKHPELAHGAAGADASHEGNGHGANGHGGHDESHGIHMPNPSLWPAITVLGFFVAAYGLVFFHPLAIAGALFGVFGVYGWTFEDVGPLEEYGTTRIETRKMMMWAFLGSDCMFFGALISTYLIYHGKSLAPPFPRQTFDIRLTSVSSFVLLMSSLLMVLTVSAIQAKKMTAFRIYCFLTALFGAIFLGFQAYEFSHFVYEHGLTLSSNLYGSTFFVLTGTHGCHVAIGVLWLLSLFFASFKANGPVKADFTGALTVEVAGLYWHFVDIVWIIIFTVVYLMEYIG